MAYKRIVKIWLLIGLVCVALQVIIGGITRLTESGLSITEWDPITGAFPPTTTEGWEEAFTLYKDTPQYKEVNEGMDMDDFKFIYFWEFVHRQWARIMGLIFLFPFLYFMLKKWIDRPLLKKLSLVILLAVLAASFGWIMVASGLIERPWVNAYKLSLHLCIAFSVYTALLFAFMHTNKEVLRSNLRPIGTSLLRWFLVLFWIQLFLGGVMSGMRIGVVYPTWPDMNGEIIPQVVFNNNLWTVESFNNYDQNELLPALIHLLHRSFAYIVFFIGMFISYRLFRTDIVLLKRSGLFLGLMLVMQVILGIITVISCQGEIPILWGVLHQGGALMLLTAVYIMYYINTSYKRS